ncbi:endonuclease [Sporolactobacillus sp. CQH2019]|uniref:endonuclease III domain-containing protein n=1 Tax=Sporolactobacillus sp. CQH2019 TaxID=3023512 RepID=UPI002367DDEA|nr:endonuclease [Sporolactobacillus sp. CQH2019]MDD9149148.1 endonuclease [Sporolactobacillus sp. CQH2019]
MKADYMERFGILLDYHGPQHWWPAGSIFEMLIGAILTQNTNWKNVAISLKKLAPFLTPEKMERLEIDELAGLIRSSGFYRLKAQRIRSFLNWYRRYDYDPGKAGAEDGCELRKELLDVKGIGEETADAMLVYAFGKPFFIADAYARRLFTRLGDRVPKTYGALRAQVEKDLPHDLTVYQEFHALIVAHAKTHCRAVPSCEHCPLAAQCESRGALK